MGEDRGEVWVDAGLVRAVLWENMEERRAEGAFGTRWMTNHLGLAFEPENTSGPGAFRRIRIEMGKPAGLADGLEVFNLPSPTDATELALMGQNLEGKAYLRSRGGWRGRLSYPPGFDWYRHEGSAGSTRRGDAVTADHGPGLVQCPNCLDFRRSDEVWKRGLPDLIKRGVPDQTPLWKHVCQSCGYEWMHWDGEPEATQWKRDALHRQ